MKNGFLKVAAATPEIRPADCVYNSNNIVALCFEAAGEGVRALVFPELCITGYTCGDLFLHDVLLDSAKQALLRIAEETSKLDMVFAVGLPLAYKGAIYNAAAVLHQGRILGFVPKQNLPNYSEFYEMRYFSVPSQPFSVRLAEQEALCSAKQLFCCQTMPELVIGVEICEDLWVAEPPSGGLSKAGATVILNLSASDETVGKAEYRRQIVNTQSARCICGYVYADAGRGESVTDLVFSGHSLIAENGALLAQGERFQTGLVKSELDLGRLCFDRRRMNTFRQDAPEDWATVPFDLAPAPAVLTRVFPKTPFVPSNRQELYERCQDILTIQASGLASRLSHTHAKSAVVGLSGGLDSALALIVTAHAFDLLKRDRRDILAVTMPCFGTTGRTMRNALELGKNYGATVMQVEIGESVRQHFRDIGQSMDDHSVTFENGQARERTQVLMDLANQRGGLVVGTGDLSELALGWATYNGDHMSMYGVNASVPKTLVRFLVQHEAERQGGELKKVLLDILDTPVSPELLPPSEGEISQKTEEVVGPYELHDFFLYYMLRFGYSPKKLFRAARLAFDKVYDAETIRKWLATFVKRFFAQQFKRSCLPDGPKVGSVALSPRGDWRMPSDASAALWIEEAEQLLQL